MVQMKSATAIIAFFFLMAVSSISTQSCTPEMNTIATMEYKIKKSDILVYGYPRQRVRDTSVQNGDVFIVDFEIRCIFKGGPLPEMIKIYNVGMKDRMCNQTELRVDTPLLVYLVREGGRIMPSYMEDPGSEQFLEEVPIICGITVTYAQGYSEENKKEECPEEWDDDEDCIALPADPTTEAAPTSEPDSLIEGGYEPPYQPVISGGKQNENNKEVKIGDEGKKGSKKSENLEETTGGTGRAGQTTASLITSLGAIAVCLFVFVVSV